MLVSKQCEDMRKSTNQPSTTLVRAYKKELRSQDKWVERYVKIG